MKKYIVRLIVLVFGLWIGSAYALDFPDLTGRVVDEAGILRTYDRTALSEQLATAEPHQVVAVSLKSLRGYEIEEYGVELGRHWGIGRKGADDGVLVIIAPNERQLRIEVGYGLEGVLTDALCSRIVNRIMLPLAKEGKYGEALKEGTVAVLKTIQGQEVVYPKNNTSEKGFLDIITPILFVFGFAVVFILGVFLMIIGHEKPAKRKVMYKAVSTTKTKSATENKKEIKIPVTENDWKKSRAERKRFFGHIIFLMLFLSIFFGAGYLAVYNNQPIGWAFIAISSIISLAFIPAWNAYRANKYFPMREWYKRGFSDSHGGSYGSGHSSSSGSSWSSGGGSSFSGGGGSFGGGGSSGRW